MGGLSLLLSELMTETLSGYFYCGFSLIKRQPGMLTDSRKTTLFTRISLTGFMSGEMKEKKKREAVAFVRGKFILVHDH